MNNRRGIMKWFGYAFVLVLAVTCSAAHAQIVAFGASNTVNVRVDP